MRDFALFTKDGCDLGDDKISGFSPVREPQGGDHVGYEGLDLKRGHQGLEGIAECDSVAAGNWVDDADRAVVVAFGELLGGKGTVIEEPHAEFEWIELGREGTEVDSEKGLWELAFEVVEVDFELTRFFETEAVGGVGNAFETNPFGSEIGCEVGVTETAALAEGLLRGDGIGAVGTPHLVNLS